MPSHIGVGIVAGSAALVGRQLADDARLAAGACPIEALAIGIEIVRRLLSPTASQDWQVTSSCGFGLATA